MNDERPELVTLSVTNVAPGRASSSIAATSAISRLPDTARPSQSTMAARLPSALNSTPMSARQAGTARAISSTAAGSSSAATASSPPSGVRGLPSVSTPSASRKPA